MLDRLPVELQAYILVYLPARTLVRTLGVTNHHFHELVEAHIQRYCLRYLGLGSYATDPADAAVLEFEAQRPIDTVTAKHTLQFSHFAPSSSLHSISLSTVAVFAFGHEGSAKVLTDFDRPRGNRSGRRGRGNSVSIGYERPRPNPYITTPFQPFLPGLHQSDQQRARQAIVSSSLDFEDVSTSRPPLSRNASATRSRSRSSSRSSRARAIASEIANAPFPFLRHNIEAANRHAYASTSSGWNVGQRFSTLRPTNDTTLGQGLESALDAYDWAGPNGGPSAPATLESRSRNTRVPRRVADKPACYAFQLDPLDSFESLILTLTARRSVEDPNAVLAAMLRGEDGAGHRMRYSKVLAEGLDRVFRDWFKPKLSASTPAPSSSTSNLEPSFSVLASTFGVTNMQRGRSYSIPPEAEPDAKLLEFDSSSCVLSIQPHASFKASLAHPALSGSSHDYLSRPPLSAQYANMDINDRVELTFHCEHVAVNTGRLLATLERLEHDVLAAQARSRVAMANFPRIVANVSSMGSAAAMHTNNWQRSFENGFLPIGSFQTGQGVNPMPVLMVARNE